MTDTSDPSNELSGWEIAIDPDVCMGSGVCTLYAGATFALSAAPAVVVDSPGDTLDAIRVAIEACPTGAIQLARTD